MFNTSLDKIFGVKKYADALSKIVKEREIKLNFKRNLFAIKPDSKEAVFEVLDGPKSEKKLLETYQVGLVRVHNCQYKCYNSGLERNLNSSLPLWIVSSV